MSISGNCAEDKMYVPKGTIMGIGQDRIEGGVGD